MSEQPIFVGQEWTDNVPFIQFPRRLRVEHIKPSSLHAGVCYARVVVVFGGKNPGTGRWQYAGQTGYIRTDRLCSERYKLVQEIQTTPAMLKEETRCISMPGMFFEYLEAQHPGWRQYSTDRLSRMLQSWQAGYAAGLKASEAGQKGKV